MSSDTFAEISPVLGRLLAYNGDTGIRLHAPRRAANYLLRVARKWRSGNCPELTDKSLPPVLDMALIYNMPALTTAALKTLAGKIVRGDADIAIFAVSIARLGESSDEVKEFLGHVVRSYFNLHESDPRSPVFETVWEGGLCQATSIFGLIAAHAEALAAKTLPEQSLTVAHLVAHFTRVCAASQVLEHRLLGISLLSASDDPRDVVAALELLKMLTPHDSTLVHEFTAHAVATIMARPDAAKYAEPCYVALELVPPAVKALALSNLLPHLEGSERDVVWRAAMESLKPPENAMAPPQDIICAFKTMAALPGQAHYALCTALREPYCDTETGWLALTYIAKHLRNDDLDQAWAHALTSAALCARYFHEPPCITALRALAASAPSAPRRKWIAAALSEATAPEPEAAARGLLGLKTVDMDDAQWDDAWSAAVSLEMQGSCDTTQVNKVLCMLWARRPAQSTPRAIERLRDNFLETASLEITLELLPHLNGTMFEQALERIFALHKSPAGHRILAAWPCGSLFSQQKSDIFVPQRLYAAVRAMDVLDPFVEGVCRILNALAPRLNSEDALAAWISLLPTCYEYADLVQMDRFVEHFTPEMLARAAQAALELTSEERRTSCRLGVLRGLQVLLPKLAEKEFTRVLETLSNCIKYSDANVKKKAADILFNAASYAQPTCFKALWVLFLTHRDISATIQTLPNGYLYWRTGRDALLTLARRSKSYELYLTFVRTLAKSDRKEARGEAVFHAAKVLFFAPPEIAAMAQDELKDLLKHQGAEDPFRQAVASSGGADFPQIFAALAKLSGETSREFGAARAVAHDTLQSILRARIRAHRGESFFAHECLSVDQAADYVAHPCEAVRYVVALTLHRRWSTNILLAKELATQLQDAVGDIANFRRKTLEEIAKHEAYLTEQNLLKTYAIRTNDGRRITIMGHSAAANSRE